MWAPGNLLYGEEWEGAHGPLYSRHAPCPCCAVCAVHCALCAARGAGPPTTETNVDPRSPGGRAEVCQEGGRQNRRPCCLGGRIRDMSLSGDLEDGWELAELGGRQALGSRRSSQAGELPCEVVSRESVVSRKSRKCVARAGVRLAQDGLEWWRVPVAGGPGHWGSLHHVPRKRQGPERGGWCGKARVQGCARAAWRPWTCCY